MEQENKKPIVKFEPGSRQPFILYLISVTIISAIIIIVCLFTSGVDFSAKKDLTGDINLDGTVNQEDARLLSDYLTETVTLTPEQLAVADVDSNGEINSKDSVLIMQHIEVENDEETTEATTTEPTTQESTSQTEETTESTTQESTTDSPAVDTEFISSGSTDNAAFLNSENNLYYIARIVNSWKDANGKNLYQIELTVKNNSSKTVYNTSADITFSGGVSVEKSWNCSTKNETGVITVTTKNDGRISDGGTFNCGFIISSAKEITIKSVTKK